MHDHPVDDDLLPIGMFSRASSLSIKTLRAYHESGILVAATARLVPLLSAGMIFLWVFLVHIPRALAGPNRVNEAAGIFEALALSGVALLVAGVRGSRGT